MFICSARSFIYTILLCSFSVVMNFATPHQHWHSFSVVPRKQEIFLVSIYAESTFTIWGERGKRRWQMYNKNEWNLRALHIDLSNTTSPSSLTQYWQILTGGWSFAASITNSVIWAYMKCCFAFIWTDTQSADAAMFGWSEGTKAQLRYLKTGNIKWKRRAHSGKTTSAVCERNACSAAATIHRLHKYLCWTTDWLSFTSA